MGRNLLSNVMEKVAVMDLLLLAPAIGTLVSPCLVMVNDDTCTYFDGVWSKLIINDAGILYSSTWLTIWCKFFSSASLWAPTEMCTFPVVFIRRTKPMRRKRLWARDLPILKSSLSGCGYRFSRAFAVAIATKEFTTPSLCLVALR